jgi:hypothetical protein
MADSKVKRWIRLFQIILTMVHYQSYDAKYHNMIYTIYNVSVFQTLIFIYKTLIWWLQPFCVYFSQKLNMLIKLQYQLD